MKRFLAGVMTAAMLVSAVPAAVSADGITAQKTNYIVGTSGQLSGGTGYSSDAADIVSVDENGKITALAPGKATISSNEGSVEITVHEKADDDMVNDIQTEDRNVDFGRWGEMHSVLANSKIWAYGMNSVFGYSTDNNTLGKPYNALMNNGGTAGQWAALIYKLEQPANGIRVRLTYDANAITAQDVVDKRVYIGYRTEDYTWQADRRNALSEMRDANGDGYSSRSYDVARIVSTSVEEDKVVPALNTDVWTPIELSSAKNLKDYDGMGTADLFAEASGIPENAQYVVVMINNGAVEGDDLEGIFNSRLIGFRGVTLLSKRSIAAGEFTADGRLALTFNADVGEQTFAVRKNGNAIETTSEYDKETYTQYISGSFAAGDQITVNFESGYEWTGVVPGTPAAVEYDRVFFNAAKHAYIEGTTGKIDVIAQKGDDIWQNTLDTTYTSSDEKVVKVDNSGNITAVAAGTATITPAVVSMPNTDFAPITVKVYVPSKVESFINDDINSGKLKLENAGNTVLSQLRNGTKLWAFSSYNYLYQNNGYNTVLEGQSSTGSYMGFVYKTEGEIENVTVHEVFYDGRNIDEANKRTDIGYTSVENQTFNDKGGGVWTWENESLNIWGAEGGIVDDATNDAIRTLDPNWTKAELADSDWTVNGSSTYASTSAIPNDAKYFVVLLKTGKLTDGTDMIGSQYMQYKGVTINYKKKLVDAELNAAKTAVLTFNFAAKDAALTITKNGTVINDAAITYSEDGYTCYVDAGLVSGDTLSITSDYGSFGTEAPDGREQIDAVSVTGANGEEITELMPFEDAAVNARVKVVNSDDSTLKVYAALYDADGRLVQVTSASAELANGSAEAEAQLEISEVPTGAKVKIFAWGDDMKPFANYKNLTTEINAADF